MRAATPVRYVLPLGFGALLLAFWLDTGLGMFSPVPSVENRRPAEFPTVKWDFLDPFPRDYEAYFNDRFRWRGRFQRFNARLQAVTNGRSPLPDLVAIGKQDWYFKGGLQLDIYRGKRRFTPAELAEVVRELRDRRDSIAARGGRYYLAVAPLKHHIYPQFLPDHVRRLNREGAVRQLYSALDRTDLDYVDLHAALRTYTDTATRHDLYYRTDHHWTVRAGLVASGALLERFRHDGVGVEPATAGGYYLTGRSGQGMTLAKMAGRDRSEQETFYTLHRRGDWNTEERLRPEISPPAKFPYPPEYAKQRVAADPVRRARLPTLFVNRESFGENLYLPLSEGFGSSFWLFDEWEHRLNLKDYEREGGDVYLQLIWEGFLFNLLDVPADDGKW